VVQPVACHRHGQRLPMGGPASVPPRRPARPNHKNPLGSDIPITLPRAAHSRPRALAYSPPAALTPAASPHCCAAVERQRFLSLHRDGGGRLHLRTSQDRRRAADLLLAPRPAPAAPRLWAWLTAAQRHAAVDAALAPPPGGRAVLVCRHGLSVANVAKDLHGGGECGPAYTDAGLSPAGRRQAAALGAAVARFAPGAAACSPLRRALQTALGALEGAPLAPRVAVLPALTECAGAGAENDGRVRAEIAADVELRCGRPSARARAARARERPRACA
jgi:hypothetical protein